MGESLLDYYRQQHFNPVPIALSSPAQVSSHFEKRRNLYERHLGLPFGWLRGKRVLEFGANSGESGVVLAAMGAHLTLVEPHEATAAAIAPLFERFGQSAQLERVEVKGLGQFITEERFDLVIAEGFLFTLDDRDLALANLAQLIAPGGFGVTSYNDRHGMLIELVRRALLWDVMRARGSVDVQSDAALAIAVELFGDDFSRQKTSRPLAAWWRDTLVNPLTLCLWTLDEILAILDRAGCEVSRTSPAVTEPSAFQWYKNVTSRADRHARLLTLRRRALWFWLTGVAPEAVESPLRDPDDAVMDDLERTIDGLVSAGRSLSDAGSPHVPDALSGYLAEGGPRLAAIGSELQQICAQLGNGREEPLISAYNASSLRQFWGAPYHYVAFGRDPSIAGLTERGDRQPDDQR